MSDLDTAYRSRVAMEEEERLRRALDEGLRAETAASKTGGDEAIGEPAMAGKAKGNLGPNYKGAQVAGETALEGIKNFGQGLANAIVPPTPGAPVYDRAMGLGQSALGVMQFVMALPAGVGANVRAALEKYAPGMEGKPAIKKGEVAGRIRATLSAPALLFDPKVKQADPQALAESLDAPITYGELLDIVTQFAVGGATGKGGVRPGKAGATAVEGPRALPAAPTPKALPPAPYEMGPSPLSVSLTDRLASDFAMGRRYPDIEAVIQESIAMRRAADAGVAPAEPPGLARRMTREQMRQEFTDPGFRTDAPSPAAATPEDVGVPSGQLVQALDIAERRVEKAIREEIASPDVSADVTGGGKAPAAAPTDFPLAGEKVDGRVVRAETPNLGSIRATLDEYEVLPGVREVPFEAFTEMGPLRYATADSMKRAKDLAAQIAESGEINPLIVVIDEKGPYILEGGHRFDALRELGAKSFPAVVVRDMESGGQAGKITPEMAGTLARMATGAAVGGSQGETTEERLVNAFIGAGLGAALSKRLAVRAVEAYKSSNLADESGAINLGAFTKRPSVQQSEAGFQPNYARIETTPETVRYMKNLHRNLQFEIMQQSRGEVRPHALVDKEAIRLLESGAMSAEKILDFQPGTVLNDAQLKAARHIVVRTAEDATAMMERVANGEQIPREQVTAAVALNGALSVNVRAAVKETGRALSSMRSTASREGAEAIRVNAERIEMVAERIRANATTEEIASAWLALKTTEKRSTFSRLLYAIPEAFLEAYYGAILSGEAVVKNALSIFAVAPMEIMSRSAGSVLPWNLYRLAKGDPRAISLGEGPMSAIAYVGATVEQLRMLRHFDEIRAQADRMGGTRMEVRPRGFEALAEIARDTGHSNLGKAMDYLHTGFSIGPDVMRATDGMAKAINGRVAIQWEAMQQAAREGLQGPGYWGRVGDLVDDYSRLKTDAIQRVAEAREHMTFTKDLEGRVTSAIQAGPVNPWLDLVYRMNLATFVRTPARVAEFATEYTPVLNGIAKNFWTEWLKGGAPARHAEGRLAAGALMMSTFGAMAMMGLVTPPEPDPRKRQLMIDAGRPPASWWDQASGKWRSYEGFEPLSTMVGMGAMLTNYLRQMPETDGALIGLAAVLSWLDTINAKSFTQAISQFVDVVFNPRSDSRVDQGLEYIRRKLASFVPAGIREIEQYVDPAERRGQPSGSFDNGTLGGAAAREWYALVDEVSARIPGLSSRKDEAGHDLVPPDRNQFTGEVILNDTWPFNPWRAREGRDAPWAREIQRLQGAGVTPLDDWIGKRAGADIGFEDRPTPPGVRMTPDEKDRLKVLMTQQVRINGRLLTEELDHIVQSDSYKRLPDVTRKDWIRGTWAAFRQKAEDTLLQERPKLRAAYNLRRGQSKVERLPVDRQENAQNLLLRSLGR